MRVLDIETPHGPARAHVEADAEARGALVLGHGAGGGIGAKDLRVAAEVAGKSELTVVLVEQPYAVAGRRSPAPARQLDAAWKAVVERLRADELPDVPLIAGGRSSGARVACRTAADGAAAAVLCLAFPLHAPGRPEKTRLSELEAVTVPTLVVQGESDPFGMPPAGRGRRVVTVRGNHSLKGDLEAVGDAVREWLEEILRG